jgi:hypothetical protein
MIPSFPSADSSGASIGNSREAEMTDSAYSQGELQSFYRLLDCVVSEVAERELPVSVFVMISRLFAAADLGTRDPEALRKAILEDDADVGCPPPDVTLPARTAPFSGRRLVLIPGSAKAA